LFSHLIFWPWFVGLIFLITGVTLDQLRVTGTSALDRLIALGPAFFAAPLAVFGTEHLVGARFLMNMVPEYMPGRLFWAYFVGVALLCAATSIILRRYISLAAALLGLTFFFFVLLLHIHTVALKPNDRFAWTVALRDMAFGGAAWVLAGCRSPNWRESVALIAIGRIAMAIALLFFGIQNILNPLFAPGVPLEKTMPAFVALPLLWSYLIGASLFVTGIAIASRKHDRTAAAWTGVLITLAVLLIYAPFLWTAAQPAQMTEAINYVADTLLFAGALLIVAEASTATHAEPPLKAYAASS
jgi:uncharacterized membrane protein